MRLAITGGGTGGHVSPALAVIEALQGRARAAGAPLDLLFVGSRDGIELRMVSPLGIPVATVQTGKLRRYPSLRTPVDLGRLPVGVAQALGVLGRFRPDALFSTGGFVCVPAVVAARLLRVPVLTHEQTMVAGLANRVAGRFADVIALSYEESRAEFPGRRTVVTGNPVRAVVLGGDPSAGARRFDLDPALPTVYVTGGAQGAHRLNLIVAEALPALLARCQVIHQCGRQPEGAGQDLERLRQRAVALPAELARRYRAVEFVGEEIGDIYALAALVIGRAGAGTIAELCAVGKPGLLVPLPGSARGEQQRHADALQDAGAALALPESELTAERLVHQVGVLLDDPERLAAMAARAHGLGRPQAAERLADELVRLARPARADRQRGPGAAT